MSYPPPHSNQPSNGYDSANLGTLGNATASSSSYHAPIKLKFRLGGGGGAISSTASLATAPIAPSPSGLGDITATRSHIEGTTETAGETVERAVILPRGMKVGPNGEKVRRKRGPNKPKVAVAIPPGPGKNWRKGLKGIGTNGSMSIVGLPGGEGSSPGPSRAGSASTGRANVLIRSRHPKTPQPRSWSSGPKEFKNVRGIPVKLNCWSGADYSAYAMYRADKIVGGSSTAPTLMDYTPVASSSTKIKFTSRPNSTASSSALPVATATIPMKLTARAYAQDVDVVIREGSVTDSNGTGIKRKREESENMLEPGPVV